MQPHRRVLQFRCVCPLKRPQMYNKTGLALWMHNNCNALSSRQILVQQLMHMMPVDLPGACLNNMDAGGLHFTSPVELMASYKFYLVLEYVFDGDDWVSSTFFRALDAGTVPVVLGAPNVLKFALGERLIIKACDFGSMLDLVKYLQYLNSNDTAYWEYLAWRENGPSPEFQSFMAMSDVFPFCKMCTVAAQNAGEAIREHYQKPVKGFQRVQQAFGVLDAWLDRESRMPCRGSNPWWHVELAEDEYSRIFELDREVRQGHLG